MNAATAPAAAATEPSSQVAVSVSHLSKAFRLPHQQYHTLKERVLHPFRSNTYDVLQAVKDVSFEVHRGEFFGIVGRNGSGKSTLLKCLAGIYGVDAGEVSVGGRLSPFIELGVGFNLDLTARDNVLINAIMLGLTPKQARARFDTIVDFAGLGEFIDLKLKNYSSGMLVRLAFSVAIQVDAEILLIDEVLAVGDAAFQQKCFDQFEEMKRDGRTIVFVTHDMGAVQRFCDRAMLLEQGNVLDLGDPGEVARHYLKLNFGRSVHELSPGVPTGELPQAGTSPAQIVNAWFENADGEQIVDLANGEECVVCVEARFNEPIDDPVFGLALRNETLATVFATSTALEHGPSGHFDAGETVTIRMAMVNWLTPARYLLTPTVARDPAGTMILDVRENLASLIVHGWHFTGGVVNLPHEFEVRRG